MIKKLFVVATAALLVSAASFSADAKFHRKGYRSVTGPSKTYSKGMGLRKQTKTGGPAGGGMNGGGGS